MPCRPVPRTHRAPLPRHDLQHWRRQLRCAILHRHQAFGKTGMRSTGRGFSSVTADAPVVRAAIPCSASRAMYRSMVARRQLTRSVRGGCRLAEESMLA